MFQSCLRALLTPLCLVPTATLLTPVASDCQPSCAAPTLLSQVEVKPDMIGHYLAEFSISYKPVGHGRPGIGSTNSSRFIPLS
jgi:hypothetical protein